MSKKRKNNKIIRILLSITLLNLLALNACNHSTNQNKMDVTIPSSVTPEPTISLQDSQNSKQIDYYGEWILTKLQAYGPVGSYSANDVESLIGKSFQFTESMASHFGDELSYVGKMSTNPVYTETDLLKSDIASKYKISFDDLGLKTESIIEVSVTDANENICTFFIKDKDTLILIGGGTYFELKKSDVEQYRDVLQNQAEFFSTDHQKKMYWNDFLSNNELYGTIFKATRFTVLDMDGDKLPEVVLELAVKDEPEFYVIFHDTSESVYGYLMVYRGLEELKEDGTFLFSNGAADTGIGKLSFGKDALQTNIIGESKSTQSDTTINISYLIEHKEVTKDSFDSFMTEQSRKKDVIWYEFSQTNMETELSTK